MNWLLYEILVITSLSFVASVAAAWALFAVLKWPMTVTYIVVVMTVGPALAVIRGRDREKDRLDIGERAAAELVALIILLALGWWLGHTFWA